MHMVYSLGTGNKDKRTVADFLSYHDDSKSDVATLEHFKAAIGMMGNGK